MFFKCKAKHVNKLVRKNNKKSEISIGSQPGSSIFCRQAGIAEVGREGNETRAEWAQGRALGNAPAEESR